LAIVVSLVMAALAFELGLCALGKGPVESLLQHDERTGWSKRPNASIARSGREFDVRIQTNQLALVDDPMSTPSKPAGTWRLLVLGDSFTQGFTVSRDDLYVDLLERRWRAQGRPIDVVNAGTEAWSTDQEVAWFLAHGETFEPDLVLLAAYENDIYWNGQARYVTRNAAKPLFRADGTLEIERCPDVGPPPWTERFATTKLLAGLISPQRIPAEHLFQPTGAARPILREFAPLLNERPEFLERSIAATGGALIALRQECERIGALPLLLAIPSHAAIDPAHASRFSEASLGGLDPSTWTADAAPDLLLRLAQASGLRGFDPRAALRAAQAERAQYFELDWHLNPAGNRTLASFLHDELDRANVLPASCAPRRAVPADSAPVQKGLDWGFVALLYVALLGSLSTLFALTYPDEPRARIPLKVGGLLALVFALFLGARELIALLSPALSSWVLLALVVTLLGVVVWKLGHRVATILELLRCFVLRGHWYLMPLLVVLLTIGSLLVVAASSPLIAPFIYTLF
ncbi:MAG: hypothetical protein FJ298_07875, partial [Planctomycetes bacterium]|nr:hypothetical protein [Planctomycetota bacterium]